MDRTYQAMLVEDIDRTSSKLPPNLATLISSLECPDANDFVVVLLYTLMLETGLVPAVEHSVSEDNSLCYGFNAMKLKKFNKMPDGWRKRDSLYEMAFCTTPQSGYKCKLLILCMQDILVVDLFIEQHIDPGETLVGSCFTMTVSPADYVKISTPLQDSKCIQYQFANVTKLAHKFKNTVASPALAFILNHSGVVNPSFLGLPEEVRMKVLAQLSVKDICNVSQTCAFLNNECEDQHLWHHFVNRDWKLNLPWNVDVNWRSFYVSEEQSASEPPPFTRPLPTAYAPMFLPRSTFNAPIGRCLPQRLYQYTGLFNEY